MVKKRRKPLAHNLLGAYVLDHTRTLLSTLGRLYRTPGSSLMTMAVIGIALALPSGLYVLIKNLQSITGNWGNVAQVSLFLKPGTRTNQMHVLANRLGARGDIAIIKTVSADQALDEFRQQSGFGQALDSLDENPLPHVIVINPILTEQSEDKVKRLAEELKRLPEVDMAMLDMQWLQRLNAMMDIARRAVVGIALLFAIAVLLIVGNTIRLDIQNRRNEIKVTKLVGATDAFIRRPFLYGGVWYGVIGGLIAWITIQIALALVENPAQRLAVLYSSRFQLLGLDGLDTLIILTLGGALGLGGSWLAVSQHLSQIEPD